MVVVENSHFQRENEPVPSQEHFSNPQNSKSVAEFIDFLKKRFSEHSPHIGLELANTGVEVEKIPDETFDAMIQLLTERFADEHSRKFGLVIKGIYTTTQFQPIPEDTSNIVFHGTDATRGSKILESGFNVPEKRKVDPNPMYGTGVSATPVSSKAAPYFSERGYSSRTREEGVIFFLNPTATTSYESKSALWGDSITLPDGTSGRWQDTYDSVIAVAKKDGGNYSAANLPEMTLRDGSQANPVAVAWVELIPASDPSFSEKFEDGLVQQEQIVEDSENEQTTRAQSLSTKIHDTFLPSETNGISRIENYSQIIKEFAKDYGISIVSVEEADYISQLKKEKLLGDSEGLALAPKEAVIIALPENSKGVLRNIILQHRKDKWYPGRSPRRYKGIKPQEVRTESDGRTSIYRRSTNSWFTLDPEISYLVNKGGSYSERDSHPAQTKIMVYSSDSNKWFDIGVKIGEPRPASEPEEERLYDLNMDTSIDLVAIIGWGEGNKETATTHVHSVEVINYPEVDNSTQISEKIYTEGVHFFNLLTTHKSEAYRAKDGIGYPNSVCVGGYEKQPFHFETPETDGLEIVPEPRFIGKTISSLEVACGDTVYGNTSSQNRSGWAELSAHVYSNNGTRIPLIVGEGVPPRGILSGSTPEKYILKAGDKIVITSNKHPVWIMGHRILFKD